jgi:hypothetical protein
MRAAGGSSHLVDGGAGVVEMGRLEVVRVGEAWNASTSCRGKASRPMLSKGLPVAITREAVAAYLAKYATKSTEATGHLSARITTETVGVYADDTHTGRLIDASWTLGRDGEYRGLRRWAHTLGYGGHFFTKSRRYTGTFTAERQRRIAWRRTRAARAAPLGGRWPWHRSRTRTWSAGSPS